MEESNNETEKQYKIKVNPEKLGIDYIFNDQNMTMKILVNLHLKHGMPTAHCSQSSYEMKCNSKFRSDRIFIMFCKLYLESWDTFLYDIYNVQSINKIFKIANEMVDINIMPKSSALSEFGAQPMSLKLIK